MDIDQTVAAAFFGILVDKAARVYRAHLSAVKRFDFLECASVGDAAVFRQAICMLVKSRSCV